MDKATDKHGTNGWRPGTARKDPGAAHAHIAGASFTAGAAIRPGEEPAEWDKRNGRAMRDAIIAMTRVWLLTDPSAEDALDLLARVTQAMTGASE